MKPRVLLVDDELSILNALKKVFRKSYEVYTASSGMEALEFLREQPVDLIISDMRMPNMTGAEFLVQCRALYPDTESILLTGYSDVESIRTAIFEGGVFGYMTKPWDRDELRDLAANAIEKQANDSTATESAEQVA